MAKVKAYRRAPDPPKCYDFAPVPEQAADWRDWFQCGTCRHWGDPKDPKDRRHPPPGTPRPQPKLTRREQQRIAAALELEARRLGERD